MVWGAAREKQNVLMKQAETEKRVAEIHEQQIFEVAKVRLSKELIEKEAERNISVLSDLIQVCVHVCACIIM